MRQWRENLLTGEDEAKPFLDHLEDLRVMLFKVIAALVIGMLVAVPVAAMIGVVARFFIAQYKAGLLYQGLSTEDDNDV